MQPLIAFALLASCSLEPAMGKLLDGQADIGEVYRCTSLDSVTEWCFDGDVFELEMALEATCRPTPRLPINVCIYACPSPPHGCNSFDGCFCMKGTP